MQLGARWRAGDPPHRSVPAELHAAIAEAERAHPEATSWTLTWLEGRPRCELGGGPEGSDGSGGALVALSASGEVVTVPRGASAGAPDRGRLDGVDAAPADDTDDADDDDWLS